MVSSIEDVRLRPAFTSRGDETVEAEVLVSGHVGRAAAPAGASTGEHEAVHLPRGGAPAAISNFNVARSLVLGVDAADSRAVADALRGIDGTENYSRIGAAVAYSVSVAAAEAAAKAAGRQMYELLGSSSQSIPLPLGNVLGGGKHAGAGSPDIQEFLVVPLNPPDAMAAVKANLTVHRLVRKEIERRDPGFPAGKGDEGAWAPRMNSLEAMEAVSAAAAQASDQLGIRMGLGIDAAASTIWSPDDRAYVYSREGRRLDREGQISFIEELADRHGLVYVEDPLQEEDFEGFAELTKWARGRGVLLVGDDIFVTSVARLRRAAQMGAGNGAILKVNQVGSLGEALEFASACRGNGYSIIASHRSGETWDGHLAHVAVGTGAVMMKSGVVGGERVAKHMELLRIVESRPGLSMAHPFG